MRLVFRTYLGERALGQRALGRWALPALVVLSLAAQPSAAGFEAGQRCKLSKKMRVLAKENGENKWRMLDAGTSVKVRKTGDEWTQIVLLPEGKRAKANTPQLLERCPAAAEAKADEPAAPVEEAPSAPAEPKPEPEVAAPVEETPPAAPAAEAHAAEAAPPAPAEAPADATTQAPSDAPTDATTDVRENGAMPETAAAIVEGDAPEPVADTPVQPETPLAPPVIADGKDPSLPLVAVLDLQHAPEDDALANALVTIVTSEVSARSELRAVSRSELQAVVNHQAEQALLGCDSVKCAADIATLVEADLVITGSVEKVGAAYVVALTLIDPTVPEVKERVEATWRSNPEEIVLLVRPYVDRLFGGANAASYVGALDVLAPDGAQLFVDGKDVGIAPLGHPITDLSIGVHTLEVAQPGFVTDTRDLVITRGDTTVTRVELMEEPLLSQWWFWTAVGGGAAVAVAAGATVGTVAIIALSAPPATTVSVKSPLPSTVQ